MGGVASKQRGYFAALPEPVSQRITLLADWTHEDDTLDAVLFHSDSDQLRSLAQTLSARPGPLIAVQGYARGDGLIALERLLIERAISVNTAAAGGMPA